MRIFSQSGDTPLLSLPTEGPVRKLSVGAFRRRLTLDEKVAINTSTDPVVQVLKEDLFSSDFVDLDFEQTLAGLSYLESIGILTEGRKEALVVDGTLEERP